MNRTNRRLYLNIGFSILGMALILGFNNCQATKENALTIGQEVAQDPTFESIDGITGTLCEQDIKREFGRTWFEFSKTNCANCHATGPGKGRFVNANINLAYDEFMMIGFDKVAKNATSPNHNAPFTGTQHLMEVNTMKVDWGRSLEKYAVCSGDLTVIPQEPQTSKITLQTIPKELGLTADNEVKTLSWPISDKEILFTANQNKIGGANIPGGVFSIQVGRYRNSSGTTFYSFFNPTISGNTVDVNIKGIFINMNGLLLTYPTTFNFLDVNVRKITAQTTSRVITNGSTVAPKVVVPQDKVSISFIDIKQIDMPPPPTPKVISITSQKITILPNNHGGFVDITLGLDSASTENIFTSIVDNSEMCGTNFSITNDNQVASMKKLSATCMPEVFSAVCASGTCSDAVLTFGRSRDIIGGSSRRRYDWDHRMPIKNIAFLAGETTKTVRIFFSQNVRKEANRLFTVEIGTISGLATKGVNSYAHVAITKHNNPTQTVGVLRFSDLMNRNFGILGLNCVRCHNSTDNAGGYDMTDYDLMIQNRVLIPSQPDSSKMYIRMNPNKNTGSKSMPVDGYMTNDKIYEVEKWILDGAKNN